MPLAPGRAPDLALALRVAGLGALAGSARTVALGLYSRYGWFTVAFRCLIWGPVSGVLPFSLALVFLNARCWLRDRVRSGHATGTQWLWSGAASCARLWAFMEVMLEASAGPPALSRGDS
ncbi:unnamed protein product [Prorocentrum cordatum]|uniref:Uncharacterized protein n=1 Tax=Prorocentrum cordatum TaxID=2364126 RepID=A0ABN9QLM5_9DINO|nr:unnamed protein product [Polarella glacialis]